MLLLLLLLVLRFYRRVWLFLLLLLLFLNCFEFFDPCNQNEFDFRSSLFVANSYCCWFELALVILANIENYWYSIKTAWLNMCLCVEIISLVIFYMCIVQTTPYNLSRKNCTLAPNHRVWTHIYNYKFVVYLHLAWELIFVLHAFIVQFYLLLLNTLHSLIR